MKGGSIGLEQTWLWVKGMATRADVDRSLGKDGLGIDFRTFSEPIACRMTIGRTTIVQLYFSGAPGRGGGGSKGALIDPKRLVLVSHIRAAKHAGLTSANTFL